MLINNIKTNIKCLGCFQLELGQSLTLRCTNLYINIVCTLLSEKENKYKLNKMK